MSLGLVPDADVLSHRPSLTLKQLQASHAENVGRFVKLSYALRIVITLTWAF